MNSRRTVILIVSVVVAALAAVGLFNYVKNAESSAGEEAATVEIWVVKQAIPKGTPIETAIETGLIGIEETAQRHRPPTAVVDPAVELAGLVAITDLPLNWPIETGSFVSPRIIDTGITDRLEERGLVTVTFNVDQTRGAAYLIEPGDFVNVLVEREWDAPFFEADPEIPLTEQARVELASQLEKYDTTRPVITDLYPVETRMVYQKVEVLAVGNSLVPDIGDTPADAEAETAQASDGLVTLAVPPEAVQVILGVGRDNIYLSLVPDDYEPRPMLPLDPTSQVVPGEVEGRLTPYDDAGIENPGLSADELLFSDAEDRIGVAPGTGSTAQETPAATPAPSTTAPADDATEGDGTEESTTTTAVNEGL